MNKQLEFDFMVPEWLELLEGLEGSEYEKLVKFIKETEHLYDFNLKLEIPSVEPYTETADEIKIWTESPGTLNPCSSCPNSIHNGGSGICHCTIPNMQQTYISM